MSWGEFVIGGLLLGWMVVLYALCRSSKCADDAAERMASLVGAGHFDSAGGEPNAKHQTHDGPSGQAGAGYGERDTSGG